jgi:DNA-binding transcriptional MerR regulator
VPSARTEAGHRRYGAPDVVRLRRIVTLKGLGVPLREIAGLLDAAPGGLLDALRAQRAVLVERRAELDEAIERIDALERNVRTGNGALSRGDLESLMETIAMEKQQQWSRRYLTEVRGMSEADADAQMASTPPEHREGAIASGVAPQSDAGRALAQRRGRALHQRRRAVRIDLRG